jgi:hypothetical protein
MRQRPGLLVDPNQQPQAFLHCGSFGRPASRLHGLVQQRVVDFAIGPHVAKPTVVYRPLILYTPSVYHNLEFLRGKGLQPPGGSLDGYGVATMHIIVGHGPPTPSGA